LLQNLIGNALQHGSDKRDVTVTLKGEPDAIRLMVHNHGSPISEDAIAIFDPLVRSADEELGQPSTSLGLGLFIVKEVVNAHQGRLKSARMKRTARGLRWYCPESFEAVATGGLLWRGPQAPATDSVFRLLHHQPPQPLPQHPVLRPQLLHLFEQVQRQGDAFPFQFQVAPQRRAWPGSVRNR
jgi:hypothetical protein